MIYTLELHKAGDGFRWRLKRKGRIVAESGEAYSSRSKLSRAVGALSRGLFKEGAVKIKDLIGV